MSYQLSKEIMLLHRATGAKYSARLKVGELDHRLNGHPYVYVVILYEGISYVGTALDYFTAFNKARARMEPDLIPMLAGACINLGMSGMMADMGSGLHGYILENVRKAERPATTEIFSCELIGELGTAAEREEFFRAWLDLPISK